MITLTNAQVLAAAAPDRLVNIIAPPGSGKTTIATERYGYLRYQVGDLRGVLGLTFNRAAASELRRRIEGRWGTTCIKPAHRIITFDQLHIELLTHLLNEGKITWPNDVTTLDVRDDYSGVKGFRFFESGSYVRFATLNEDRTVVSKSREVEKQETGIGRVEDHRSALGAGIVSHSDVRTILRKALQIDELRQVAVDWISSTYRAMIIDEVYDADNLDLQVAYLGAEAGLSVTLIGDPWQTLYHWRGAEPEGVKNLTDAVSEEFKEFEQTESFRFFGNQMPELAVDLRCGRRVTLPKIVSTEIDVALARTWRDLWSVGDNILPISFQTVNNKTDAALNLLLDFVTRSRFGIESYGREGAITRLGLDRERFQARQDDVLGSLLASLCEGKSEEEVLDDLREAIKSFGVRRPKQLSAEKEEAAMSQLARLAVRLDQTNLVPGLTIFQAKGREWDQVGVVLGDDQVSALCSGLDPSEEKDRIAYVAITRAKFYCGRLISIS